MPENSELSDYPACLDLKNLPATHNYVIGAIQPMSLDNIRGVLAVIHRLFQENDRREIAFGEEEINGLSCILDNAFHALKFEQYHRARYEDPNHLEK